MASCVTLHVSVWVEILWQSKKLLIILSRSTWACELKCICICMCTNIWTSRSTWACELKYDDVDKKIRNNTSRSTWACELKCSRMVVSKTVISHAPRERVSWNLLGRFSVTEMKVTLHVSVWVEINRLMKYKEVAASRSTWACELKCGAPKRERGVSKVTLHVSVWVEISDLLRSAALL